MLIVETQLLRPLTNPLFHFAYFAYSYGKQMFITSVSVSDRQVQQITAQHNKARDAIRITAAEMKYMRRTAGYTWTDYKTKAQIANVLKITPILDKLLEYKRSWIQHVNRMPQNRLPRVMKYYSATGRRNHGRPLKKLLDT